MTRPNLNIAVTESDLATGLDSELVLQSLVDYFGQALVCLYLYL